MERTRLRAEMANRKDLVRLRILCTICLTKVRRTTTVARLSPDTMVWIVSEGSRLDIANGSYMDCCGISSFGHHTPLHQQCLLTRPEAHEEEGTIPMKGG